MIGTTPETNCINAKGSKANEWHDGTHLVRGNLVKTDDGQPSQYDENYEKGQSCDPEDIFILSADPDFLHEMVHTKVAELLFHLQPRSSYFLQVLNLQVLKTSWLYPLDFIVELDAYFFQLV